MLNVGMSEILVFAIIALIVLGPDKLPTAVRTVIKWYRHVKLMIGNVQRDIERELEITEIRDKMDKELSRIRAIEEQMQAQLNQIQKNVDLLEKDEPKTQPELSHKISAEHTDKVLINTELDTTIKSQENTDKNDISQTDSNHHKAIA